MNTLIAVLVGGGLFFLGALTGAAFVFIAVRSTRSNETTVNNFPIKSRSLSETHPELVEGLTRVNQFMSQGKVDVLLNGSEGKDALVKISDILSKNHKGDLPEDIADNLSDIATGALRVISKSEREDVKNV